jgi:4-hydroxybenzoate polyprenyltransferase
MAQEIELTISDRSRREALSQRGYLRLLLVAMRPHQWVKNLFIFAPLLFGRKLLDSSAVGLSLLAFLVYCLMCSALYMLNDCLDAAGDRAHPEKRFRPIASGALPAAVALTGAAALLIIALSVATLIGTRFLLVAIIYSLLMIGYSVVFKRIMILDSMVISAGFVLRVIGGALAVGVMATHWLIVCAFLLALFLAFTKRRQELLLLSDGAAGHRRVLGEYTVEYLDQVNNILIAASIVCYALYTVAADTVARFGTDDLIYGTVFVMYGLLRYMALTRDPLKGSNPSKMLLKDKPLMLAVCGWAIYNTLVIYQSFLAKFWSH